MKKRKLKNWQLHLFNKECKEIICKIDLPDGIDCRELAIYNLFDCVWSYPIFNPLNDKDLDKEYEENALKIEEWVKSVMNKYKQEIRDDSDYIECDLGSVLEDRILHNMGLTWEDWNNFDRIRNNDVYQQCLLYEYIKLFEKICYSRSVEVEFIRDFEWALQEILDIKEQWKEIPYSDNIINEVSSILNIYRDSIK